MNKQEACQYDPWQRHAELIDALAEEARKWAAMAKRQKRIVESYNERRRYPKRKNRIPERREVERG